LKSSKTAGAADCAGVVAVWAEAGPTVTMAAKIAVIACFK